MNSILINFLIKHLLIAIFNSLVGVLIKLRAKSLGSYYVKFFLCWEQRDSCLWSEFMTSQPDRV